MVRCCFLTALFFGIAISADFASAQVIQLPTVSSFSVNTTVSVPDGGTLVIAGASTSATSSSRSGLSRGTGRSVAPVGVSVSPTLILQSEVEAELERRGRAIIAAKARPEIHGTVQQQNKASFIVKNLGRGLR